MTNKIFNVQLTENSTNVEIINNTYFDYIWLLEEPGTLTFEDKTWDIPANSLVIKAYSNKDFSGNDREIFVLSDQALVKHVIGYKNWERTRDLNRELKDCEDCVSGGI